MIKVYPAVFHLEDGTYWVEFPDIPGCFSDGATLEDALTNAQEAMARNINFSKVLQKGLLQELGIN